MTQSNFRERWIDQMDAKVLRRGETADAVFAKETYAQAVDDVKVLLPTHWAEMAQRQDDIPLDPNWDFYEKAFAAGFATIYTARVGGELVGYVIFFITPRHTHYAHRWAKDDTIWLKTEHRNVGLATKLFDLFESDLAKGGPIVIQIETRHGHPELEYLLKARGYDPTGRIFGKRFV
jgi:ribosomal protein S18 acetylase RimI-like enzyme